MSQHWVAVNPYQGLAESVVTSNVLDLRDSFAWSASVYTSSGTVSNLTLQLSNSSVSPPSSAAEASFQNRLAISAATFVGNIDGVRYARFLRTASLCSWTIDFAKHVIG